jgi:hypothetical protein
MRFGPIAAPRAAQEAKGWNLRAGGANLPAFCFQGRGSGEGPLD